MKNSKFLIEFSMSIQDKVSCNKVINSKDITFNQFVYITENIVTLFSFKTQLNSNRQKNKFELLAHIVIGALKCNFL